MKFFNEFLKEMQNKILGFLNDILKGGDRGRKGAKKLQFKINPLLLIQAKQQLQHI